MAGLFGTLATVNQRNQAMADEQAAMPYLMSAYGNPTGALPPGQQGPVQTPMQGAISQASTQQPSTFLGNLGSAFGFGAREGRITPGALGQIAAISDARIKQLREAEMSPIRKQFMESQINRNNAAAEKARRPTAGSSARGGGPETALWTQLADKDLEYGSRIEALNQAANDLEQAEKSGNKNRALEIRMQKMPIAIGEAATPQSLRSQVDLLESNRAAVRAELQRRRTAAGGGMSIKDQGEIDQFLKDYSARSNPLGQAASAPPAGAPKMGPIEQRYAARDPSAGAYMDAFKAAHGLTGDLSEEDVPAFEAWLRAQLSGGK